MGLVFYVEFVEGFDVVFDDYVWIGECCYCMFYVVFVE